MRQTIERRFRGRILGVGTTSGMRLVVGMWDDSPFGPFTDVFVERADGTSLLLAPDDRIAEYVSGTYRFDDVHVVDVHARRSLDRSGAARAGAIGAGTADSARPADRTRVLDVAAGPLRARITVGGITALGRLLRIVPAPLATSPTWLAAIDPVARLLVRGAGTAGSAGNGRREYYGVTGARAVTGIAGSWGEDDLGTIARLDPPVRFGFASMPAAPQVVTVESVIREPHDAAGSQAADHRVAADSHGTDHRAAPDSHGTDDRAATDSHGTVDRAATDSHGAVHRAATDSHGAGHGGATEPTPGVLPEA